MLSMLAGLLLIIGQSDSTGAQAGDPYNVEDPFALEEAPPAVATPAVAQTIEEAVEEAVEPSDDALICRSRPALGSRTRYYRTCMTALQWEHHETNMEQQRRDINDMGAQGCDRNHNSSSCIQDSARPR